MADARLVAMDGRVFAIFGEAVVGREDGNGVVIRDPSVSRTHAKLTPTDGGWIVSDLGSSNGTYLNELPVREPVLVSPGGQLRFGEVRMRLDYAIATRPTEVSSFERSPSASPLGGRAPDLTGFEHNLSGCASLVSKNLGWVALIVIALILLKLLIGAGGAVAAWFAHGLQSPPSTSSSHSGGPGGSSGIEIVSAKVVQGTGGAPVMVLHLDWKNRTGSEVRKLKADVSTLYAEGLVESKLSKVILYEGAPIPPDGEHADKGTEGAILGQAPEELPADVRIDNIVTE